MFKVNVPYPSTAELTEILARTTTQVEPSLQPVASGEQLLSMQALARRVPVPTNVADFVSRLVIATHPGQSPSSLVNSYVRYGASPRGAQSIILGAKALALIDNRFNVSFDDVFAVAPAALRHRLLLNFEGQAEGVGLDTVIADLLTSMPTDSRVGA